MLIFSLCLSVCLYSAVLGLLCFVDEREREGGREERTVLIFIFMGTRKVKIWIVYWRFIERLNDNIAYSMFFLLKNSKICGNVIIQR